MNAEAIRAGVVDQTLGIDEIYSAIEMGAKEGMISVGRALSALSRQQLIDSQEVARHASLAALHST